MQRRSGRRKQNSALDSASVELNVMPFIDVFSLLCTFLLFSAAFMAMGILEVQIPFLTNAAQNDKKEQDKMYDITVDATPATLKLAYALPPAAAETESYTFSEEGLGRLHAKLAELKTAAPKSDKINLLTSTEMLYGDIVKVVDAVKLRVTGDQKVPGGAGFLFEKVVMGSVMVSTP